MIEQNTNLAALSAAGVAVWLDDLSRERLRSGNLAELIATKSVVGVTTQPHHLRQRGRDGQSAGAAGRSRSVSTKWLK